jgi:hypothetical protein
MSNLLALSPKATPLVSIFFVEMSKKRQRCTVAYLENNDFGKVYRRLLQL